PRRPGDGLRDRELLAPRGGNEAGARRLARHAHLDLVARARLEQHKAAAALAAGWVEPHIEALTPCAVTGLAELHRAARHVGRGLPVQADRLERRPRACAVRRQAGTRARG